MPTVRILIIGSRNCYNNIVAGIKVEVTSQSFALGEHYEVAEELAKRNEFEDDVILSDEHETLGKALLPLIPWHKITADNPIEFARERRIQDPDLNDCLNFLEDQAQGTDAADKYIAIYWFARNHAAGQWSNLHKITCSDLYSPGPVRTFAKDIAESDSVLHCYNLLSEEFAGMEAEEFPLEMAIAQVSNMVCTKGVDEGVILLSTDTPVKYNEELQCQEYLNPYFSQLGEALVQLYHHLVSMRKS